jgi:hypothetical protein
MDGSRLSPTGFVVFDLAGREPAKTLLLAAQQEIYIKGEQEWIDRIV